MTLTYTDDHARPYGETPAARAEEPYVPVYARGKSRKARKTGVRSWMILAPVGVLVLGGAAALMLMNGDGREAAPLEPAATAPVLPAAPAALAPGAAATSAPVEATPVARDAAPAARAAPVRRAAPAAAPAPARRAEAAPTPARVAPAEPTTETTVTLNTAPATGTPPPPRIVVAPLE